MVSVEVTMEVMNAVDVIDPDVSDDVAVSGDIVDFIGSMTFSKVRIKICIYPLSCMYNNCPVVGGGKSR